MNEFDSLKDKLREIIDPVVKDNFMELVDLEVAGGSYIRVIIDKLSGNISLDDCSFVSKRIEEVLDASSAMYGKYSLEVSSPGLNRKLKKPADFERFRGRKAKIVLNEPFESESVFTGIIAEIDGSNIHFDNGRKEIIVDFGNIKKAKLEPDIFKQGK